MPQSPNPNPESSNESSDESSDESLNEHSNKNSDVSSNKNSNINSDDDDDGIVIVTGKGINKRILSASSLKLEIDAVKEDLLSIKKIYRRKKQKLALLLKKI